MIAVVALVAVMLSGSCHDVFGDVTLPAFFSDRMVLQPGRETRLWGWGEPGEEVAVTIVTKENLPDATSVPEPVSTVSVVTGSDGRWIARLPGPTKSAVVEIKVSGKNTLVLKDVLIGDVWLCSGQSNMEWPVKASLNHQQEIAEAKFPSIRIFKVERSTARTPQSDLEGKWVECSPESVGDISAVGYFFARELHQKLKRPIGIIQAAHGGAICEAWTSDGALKSDPDFMQILERADKANSDPAQANNPNRASVLFNGMISPLLGFPTNKGLAIKGVIWYQGESNAVRAHQYSKLFPLMIADWRRGWGIGDFPFLYVQVANYISDKSKPDYPETPEESAWAELRDSQRKALSVPKTGMAVTIDIGEPRDIHPRNKQEVGRRLALSALKLAYGKKLIGSGPEFKAMKVVGREVELEFQPSDGLVAHGQSLEGFAVAGADRKFVWANARIDGDKVIVSAETILEPVAVRYAWGDNPRCNLFNHSGLPASPFRTDDWPGITTHHR